MTFLLITLLSGSILVLPSSAQTAAPESIALSSTSLVCTGGTETASVSVTLPPSATISHVDVFLLFDDTGSFASFVPTVGDIFTALAADLRTSIPDVDFGFGVGRFEDYGGPGSGFSFDTLDARPFVLNQPIVTSTDAGGDTAQATLISDALAREAPGFGGDGPESAIEALFQLSTGAGFDGDGNGSSTDSGPAGTIATQTAPGDSGDVPTFATNLATTSGTLGGAGWRSSSLKIVILATDIASVSPFPAGEPIPTSIHDTTVSEPSSAFSSAGGERFGFVADAKSPGDNTVVNAVAPSGSASVQEAVTALNELGIRVLGMGPGAAPTTSTAPTHDPSTLLSALARLTGAVNGTGTPLVFDTSGSPADLKAAIVDAVSTTATLPIDIGATTTTLPTGLAVSFDPVSVADVGPGAGAEFLASFTGDGSAITGSFDIEFVDLASGAVLGSVPVTVSCEDGVEPPPLPDGECGADPVGIPGEHGRCSARSRIQMNIDRNATPAVPHQEHARRSVWRPF